MKPVLAVRKTAVLSAGDTQADPRAEAQAPGMAPHKSEGAAHEGAPGRPKSQKTNGLTKQVAQGLKAQRHANAP